MSDHKSTNRPLVFISVIGNQTVVITPKNTLSELEWAKLGNEITKTYINECILGEHRSPDGRGKSAHEMIEFMKRHPEWDCDFIQGHSVTTWMLVE